MDRPFHGMGVAAREKNPDIGRLRAEIVTGVQHHRGQRLHILQIGLGTFNTFVHNLTDPDEEHWNLTWLLGASSNRSKDLLGVGVEPVPEHVSRLRPALKSLPNASLVQAAIGKGDEKVTVSTVTHEHVLQCLGEVQPSEQQSFCDAVSFLRNMYCVGQVHPEFPYWNNNIEEKYGLTVKTEQVEVAALSYATLSHMLDIGGVEILMIDAEGHDCQILQSMIEHCIAEESRNVHAWPEVVQFETMGHSNHVGDPSENSSSEQDTIRSLQSWGYLLYCVGQDTLMVHGESLSAEPRLQDWTAEISCGYCGLKEQKAWPLIQVYGRGVLCWECNEVSRRFGPSVWERWEQIPVELEDVAPNWRVESATSDGTDLWVVGVDGRVVCCRSGSWEDLGGVLKTISVSDGGAEVWGIDREGSLAHQVSNKWVVVPTDTKMQDVEVSGDGSAVWCVDVEHSIHVFTIADQKWDIKSGYLQQLSLIQGGSEVCGINLYNEVYRWSSWRDWDSDWERIDGELFHISMSDDGYHIWGIGASNTVWYKAGRRGYWLKIPGRLTKVKVSRDGSKVYGIDVHGGLWAFELLEYW